MVKTVGEIFLKMLAVFTISALGVLGAGAVAGVDVFQAVFMAGVLGIARVVEDLARSYLDDGKLSQAEINAAFKKEHKRSANPNK